MFHPKGPTFVELARQALSSTERGYDLLAPKFDFTPFRTPNEILQVVAQRVKSLGKFDAALDVGCGTGAAMQTFRPLCREKIVGIDMSQGMLEVAQEYAPFWDGSAAVEFVRGNVLEMPFDAEFDLAFSFGAFGHILPKDENRFIGEIARCLKSGGRFVFVTTEMPPVISPAYWFARAFNTAMHIRNWIHQPPFVMFYLTFLLPDILAKFKKHGFELVVESPFTGYLRRLRMVVAKRVCENET